MFKRTGSLSTILNLTAEELDRHFAAFHDGDGCLSDLIARCVVVTACGVAMWLITRQIVMPVWSAIYLILNLVYFRFLHRQEGAATKSALTIAIALSSAIALWYGAMAVYIASLDNGAFLILAACGVIGAALHCLHCNSEFSISSLVDLMAVILPAIGVSIFAAKAAPSSGASIATLLGCLCVIGYFCFSFRRIVSDRASLKNKIRADLQDQKMRALGQLTSGVAHDFNNLLAVVIGNLEMTLNSNPRHQNVKFLSDARSAAQSGADLIKQLMAYASQSNLKPADVEVGELFERLTSVLSRVLPARITLDIHVAEPHAGIHCDPVLLETALLNLVINARDAIGKQNGQIRIDVSEDHDAGQISIRVRDSGPGMEKEILERATEPFFTTKLKGEGSGLGLSMVRGFVKQCNGMMTLGNLQTGGFMVHLMLPAAKENPLKKSA